MEPIPEEKRIWGQTSKRTNNNTPVVGDNIGYDMGDNMGDDLGDNI